MGAKGLLLLQLFLLPSAVRAQDTADMLKEGRTWEVLRTRLDDRRVMEERVAGDTVIDGRQYKKFWRDGSYVCGLRQEGRKVYACDSFYGESLLYDFDMQVGDSMRTREGGYLYCVYTDSVLLNGSYARRQVTGPREDGGVFALNYNVEGVGGVRGPIDNVEAVTLCVTLTMQSCRDADGTYVYGASDFSRFQSGLTSALSPAAASRSAWPATGERYDLLGRRLQGSPSGGLFIQDGRKRMAK